MTNGHRAPANELPKMTDATIGAKKERQRAQSWARQQKYLEARPSSAKACAAAKTVL